MNLFYYILYIWTFKAHTWIYRAYFCGFTGDFFLHQKNVLTHRNTRKCRMYKNGTSPLTLLFQKLVLNIFLFSGKKSILDGNFGLNSFFVSHFYSFLKTNKSSI